MPNYSSYSVLNSCVESRPGLIIFAAFSLSNIFLIPLFVLILYMGYQQSSKQRSGSTMTSHLDILTYNVTVLELISLVGCFLYCCGGFLNISSMIWLGVEIFSFTSPGQSLFHVLTCVERYLAVVHPITYLGLRQARGVRIRNISIGCVWLLCLTTLAYSNVSSQSAVVFVICCFMVVLIIIVTFCSCSVLWILIRPGPGEGGRNRDSVDQSKQRAFHTITVIMAVLWLRFVGVLIGGLMSGQRFTDITCVIASSIPFLTMPGSLVLPLLFLHRAGKLPGCKRNK